jgi:hypothetical protein
MSGAVVGNMLVDLWESVREHIPEKKREDVAATMIEVLLNHDFIENVKELEEAMGTDIDLDAAIVLITEEHGNPMEVEDLDEYDE